ncbi:mitochondrial carrier domain-containing protein [Pestalotiopsis sp. NC0098]|nr:mitochondrial carrier domain-containing protein [Pestalotiopsis sp. NC0098]
MSKSLYKSIDDILPALHHALSGSAGTLISTCAVYPLSLVVTRLQVQVTRTGRLAATDEYAGIVDAFSRILQDGEPSASAAGVARSIAALYTGLTTESAKSVLDSFLFFLFYELFRSRSPARRDGSRALRVLAELATGVAAGACSRAFTTPIANVVTRKQTGAMVDGGAAGAEQLSVQEIVRGIRREKGVRGLWSGYSATLVLTLNPGITFFLQDFLTKSILGDDNSEDPGPGLTFLLAASSKAIASTITYPFQTAKARLQAGVPEDPKSPSEGGQEQQSKDSANKSPSQSGHVKPQAADRSAEGGEDDDKLDARRAIHKFAQQSVFGTIAQIVRTEGVGALYGGVHGELLKSFFSHGTTMLAKGLIHRLLFRLYLLLAGFLQELRTKRHRSGL